MVFLKKSRFLFLLLLSSVGLLLISSSCQEKNFDLIIKNGSLIDGRGIPAIQADLGIKDGQISEIGNLNFEQRGLRTEAG